MIRHSLSGAASVEKPYCVDLIHIVAHAVDGQKYHVDAFGKITEDLFAVKCVAGYIIYFAFGKVFNDNAYSVRVAVRRLDGGKTKAVFVPFDRSVKKQSRLPKSSNKYKKTPKY